MAGGVDAFRASGRIPGVWVMQRIGWPRGDWQLAGQPVDWATTAKAKLNGLAVQSSQLTKYDSGVLNPLNKDWICHYPKNFKYFRIEEFWEI